MLLTKRSTLTLITLVFVTLMALGLAAFPQASIHADPGGKGKDQETVVKAPTEEEQVVQEGKDPGKVVKEPTEVEPVAQEGNDPVKVVKEPTEVEPVAQEGNDPVKVAKEPTEEEQVAQEGNDPGKVVKEPNEEEQVAQEGNDPGKVVKEPTEEGQEAPNGNQLGVTRVRSKQFHSMTRKDCSFQLIKTELEFEYIMDLSDLKWGDPTSRDEVVKSEVVVTLEKLLKNKRSVVGRAELTMVARALNLSVSVILEMSEEEIQSLISRITTTTTQVMTIYSFPVTGKITVQEVTIRHDFWKWVGKDCGELGALPAEELVSKEIGDPRTYTIDSTVIIVEYHASTIRARGYDWAKAKATEKIQRGAWVP